MKKWNGKKKIGRKARASRAARMGLVTLAPGLYRMQVTAVNLAKAGNELSMSFKLLGDQAGRLKTRVKL